MSGGSPLGGKPRTHIRHLSKKGENLHRLSEEPGLLRVDVGGEAKLGARREQELEELQHVSYLPSDRCMASSSASSLVMSRVTDWCCTRSGPS